jgi:hypothetical protein
MSFHSLVVAATHLAGPKGSSQYSVNTPHIYITRLDGVYESNISDLAFPAGSRVWIIFICVSDTLTRMVLDYSSRMGSASHGELRSSKVSNRPWSS